MTLSPSSSDRSLFHLPGQNVASADRAEPVDQATPEPPDWARIGGNSTNSPMRPSPSLVSTALMPLGPSRNDSRPSAVANWIRRRRPRWNGKSIFSSRQTFLLLRWVCLFGSVGILGPCAASTTHWHRSTRSHPIPTPNPPLRTLSGSCSRVVRSPAAACGAPSAPLSPRESECSCWRLPSGVCISLGGGGRPWNGGQDAGGAGRRSHIVRACFHVPKYPFCGRGAVLRPFLGWTGESGRGRSNSLEEGRATAYPRRGCPSSARPK